MKASIIYAKLDPFFFQNRKVIRAGRNGREVFLFALCINAQRGALGHIPCEDLEPWYVARMLGISESEATIGINEAESAGLLYADGNRIMLGGWSDDWARRAKTDAERQSEYKLRKKQKIIGTEQSGSHDDTVTQSRESHESRIRERDRSERETGVTAGDSLSLLGHYVPSERAGGIAKERRLDLAHELAQFRDKNRAKKYADLDEVEGRFCAWLRQSKDVDRKPDKALAPRAQGGAYVSSQVNGDTGEAEWVLTQVDGNVTIVDESEAKKYPGYKAKKAAGGM